MTVFDREDLDDFDLDIRLSGASDAPRQDLENQTDQCTEADAGCDDGGTDDCGGTDGCGQTLDCGQSERCGLTNDCFPAPSQDCGHTPPDPTADCTGDGCPDPDTNETCGLRTCGVCGDTAACPTDGPGCPGGTDATCVTCGGTCQTCDTQCGQPTCSGHTCEGTCAATCHRTCEDCFTDNPHVPACRE